MSKGKKVTIGYRYRLGFQLVLCQGGADEIIRIRYEDRIAWEGSVTFNSTLTINKPNLFGGDKKQGGLQGDIDFMFGSIAQTTNTYLAYHANRQIIPNYLSTYDFLGGATGWISATGGSNQVLVNNGGIAVPAYQGVVSMVFKKFMYGAMTPYLKPFRITVRRIPKTLGVTNATITIDGRQNANPAHMIYDVLTNQQWGQGLNSGDIDLTSFTTAAATLASEGFGLSLLWKNEGTADDFINLILSHISASLYPDPATGKYTLKLLRYDYTLANLITLDETNVLDLRSYQRTSNNDLTNELTVEYFDPANQQEAKITVQNLAAIRSVGKVVRRVIQYPGIRSGALASRVAQRDLLAFSTPLAKLSLEVNLTAWNLRPGDVFKFSWSKLGIVSVVFRVLEVEYGALRDNRISITAVEDVFAVPSASYIGTQAPLWQTTPTGLSNITNYKMFDTPYYSLIQYFGEDYTTKLVDNRNFTSVVVPRANGLWSDYKLYENVSSTYVERDIGSFSPFVSIADPLTQMATTVNYAGFFDLELVTLPSLAIVDDEIIQVTAINTGSKQMTIVRGVLDTIPAAHAATALIYIYGDNYLLDEETERFAAESVTYKFIPRASGDELSLTNATARSITISGRQQKPYPPGNVKINSLYFPSSVNDYASVTWAHRDRTQQTVSPTAWTAANIGPETGATYTLIFYSGATNTIVHQTSGLTDTTYLAGDTLLGETADLRLELKTVRNGLNSFQTFIHRFTRILNRSAYGINVLSESPVGYWRLSDGAASELVSDYSPNDRNGTPYNLSNSEGLLVPNDTNNAYSFNGTNAAIVAPYVAAFAPSQLVSVEAWVKFATLSGSNYTIAGRIVSGGGYGIRVSSDAPLATKSLGFWVRRSSVWGVASYPVTSLNTNEVYHVVGTFDGRYTRLYVDGVLVSTDDAGSTYNINYAANIGFGIGSAINTSSVPSSEYLSGALDEVSVYPSTLSGDVVRNHYKHGVNRQTYREDPLFGKVVLLMHMEGANNSTAFTEMTGRVVTVTGNTIHSTAQAKFGSSSAYFDGTGDYLTVPASSDFAFGTGDFTVECWAYQTNLNTWRISNRAEWAAAPGTWGFNITPTSVAFTQVIADEPGVSKTGLASVQNQWAHYAACRVKGIVRLYRNGALIVSGTDTTNYVTGNRIKIGVSDTTNSIQGYIDEVRITRGGRYCTPTIVLQQEAWPETHTVAETSDPFWSDKTLLLMPFNTNFSDIKGATVTTTGAPEIIPSVFKFGGGSAYFNGSTDWLSIAPAAPDFTSGNFTVECWVYIADAPVDPYTSLTLFNAVGATQPGMHIYFLQGLGANMTLQVANNVSASANGVTNVPFQSWFHLAVTKFGDVVTGYVNGKLAVQNTTQQFTAPTSWQIGVFGNGTSGSFAPFNGYIDNFRITSAIRYFSDFTPSKLTFPAA